MRQPQEVKVMPFDFRSGVAEATWRFWTEYDSGVWFPYRGSHGYQTTARQNAFLYRAISLRLP
jgi:hypothetical protein